MRERGSVLSPARVLMMFCAVLLAALCCGCPRGRDPEALIANFETDDQDEFDKSVDELVRMGRDALPNVLRAARSEHERTREGAARVLAETHSVEALEAVATFIEKPDPSLRVRVAAAQGMAKLAEVRKSRGVGLLESALRGGQEPQYVKAAAQSLRELRYKDATELLMEVLREGKGLAAVYSAHALYAEDRLPQASEFLLESLASGDAAVRAAAGECINELADQIVDDLLNYLAGHPGAQGADRAVLEIRNKLLEELGKNLMPERVREIVRALGKIADGMSVEKLAEIAFGRAMSVSSRVEAALAMATAGLSERTPQARRNKILELLEKRLRDENLDIKVRIACAISLCKLKQPSGVKYLLAQLSEKKEADAELRISAQEALAASEQFVVPYLINKLKDRRAGDTMYWAAAKTLGELRVKDGVPDLARLLAGSEAAYVRWSAAIALGQIGGQDALNALRAALERETEPKVRFYIQRAIKELRGELPAA